MAGEPDEVVVLSGDTPLLTGVTVRLLVERRRTSKAAVALATMTPEDATGYGRIVRDRGQVARIVEDKDARKAERGIAEVNGGLYAFDGAWLRARIGDLTTSKATGERYLTELVALARADGRRVVPVEIDDEMELAGVNDRVQLATLEADLRWRILERHLLAGVTMQDPTTTFVDADVELGQDVVARAQRPAPRPDPDRCRDRHRRQLAARRRHRRRALPDRRQRPRVLPGRRRRAHRTLRPPACRCLDR